MKDSCFQANINVGLYARSWSIWADSLIQAFDEALSAAVREAEDQIKKNGKAGGVRVRIKFDKGASESIMYC